MAQSPHASNHLLASLGADELAALLPHLKAVELPQETVFFESGDAVKSIYFPRNALVSLVVDLTAGGMIEAAMIGRDGVAGGSAGCRLGFGFGRGRFLRPRGQNCSAPGQARATRAVCPGAGAAVGGL
jgi:hypothetical protein